MRFQRISRSRRRIAGPAIVAAGIAVCTSACGPTEAPPLVPDRVILITVDTLRADHLRSFGYPIDTAPFIDGLAAQGTSFKRAYAQSATTGPSHSSMFTGLYPIQHRVQNNGQVLDDSFVTLAEELTAAGFRTAAFVSGMAHFRASRIAQGFEEYNQPKRAELTNGSGANNMYRVAEKTSDLAIDWLRTVAADERFFLWVHYYDPHKPFLVAQEYIDRATPVGVARDELFAFLEREQDSDVSRPRINNDIHRYDAEVMYVDEQIRRLYEAQQELGLGDRSLWVVTSDHGQGLANHGWFGHHEQIYNVQLHVPLIFHASDGSLAAGEIDDQIVEHVDLPVTILDLLGLSFEGQPAPVQGRSVVPLLRGEGGYEHKRYSFAARRKNLGPGRNREQGERYSLQTLRYKYLWFSEGEDEFYDLLDDPYESVNLINEDIAAKETLRSAIEEMVPALADPAEAQIVDEETLEQLRALGYIR